MRVAITSAEVAPFAKTGGLGDVAASLGRYLHEHGHDVRMFVPLYGNLRTGRDTLVPVEFLQGIPIWLGKREFTVSVYTAPLPGTSFWVHFISCPSLFARRSIYCMDGDEHMRFGLLSIAALVACQRMAFAPDVVHVHDWHTALTPLYLRTHFAWDELFADTKTVLTLHNLAYQGYFPADVLPDLGLQEFAGQFEMQDLAAGRVGFMKTGILYADAVTAVSETYAREIRRPEHGLGLDGLLRARAASVHGITNGVDYSVWSPENDELIPHRFSADKLAGKAKCKKHLVETLGMKYDAKAPLVGVVTRLTKQKGFELTVDALPIMLRDSPAQLIVLGSGEPSLEEFFTALERRFPEKVRFLNRYDNEAAHLIEAGADMFLMPSLFEPCGLNQMYSLRYGTVPIVRRTGGLADTVEPYDPKTGRGTGFVFDHFTKAGFSWALDQAFSVWKDKKAWRRLQQNGMAQDFSWDRQVAKYVALYESL